MDQSQLEAIVVGARAVCQILIDPLIGKARPNGARYVEEDVPIHVPRRLEDGHGIHPRLRGRIGMIEIRDIV
jgi:hypothetical protein